MILRIGTRASPLALWQARTVARLLNAQGIQSELVNITTAGDRLQQAPLSEVGGKRLFVKEIEEALLRDDIDLARNRRCTEDSRARAEDWHRQRAPYGSARRGPARRDVPAGPRECRHPTPQTRRRRV